MAWRMFYRNHPRTEQRRCKHTDEARALGMIKHEFDGEAWWTLCCNMVNQGYYCSDEFFNTAAEAERRFPQGKVVKYGSKFTVFVKGLKEA